MHEMDGKGVVALDIYQRWLRGRQRELEQAYQLSRCDWRLSQDAGTVTYTRHGQAVAVATVKMIGSFCASNATWLWAWANPAIERQLSVAPHQIAQWAGMVGIQSVTEAVIDVPKLPALWADQAHAWQFEAMSQTAVSRLVSLVAFHTVGLGVHYYTNRERTVLGGAVITGIYRPVRSV